MSKTKASSFVIIIGILACVSLLHAQQNEPGYFPTLPPHAQLPSGNECAAEVLSLRRVSVEVRPQNQAANHTIPTREELDQFHLRPVKGTFVPPSDFLRVDGNFTGTTDQILRWGACKWGIDENVVRAEAVSETHWRQYGTGDQSTNPSLCPPGQGFNGAWNGNSCMQSYGIMQMKFTSFGGFPLSKDSTSFNVDFRLAYQRACMNGDINYLPRRIPPPGYPTYPNGDTDQMLWGCMGDWFSGSWYDAGAIKYIADVRSHLAGKDWQHLPPN